MRCSAYSPASSLCLRGNRFQIHENFSRYLLEQVKIKFKVLSRFLRQSWCYTTIVEEFYPTGSQNDTVKRWWPLSCDLPKSDYHVAHFIKMLLRFKPILVAAEHNFLRNWSNRFDTVLLYFTVYKIYNLNFRKVWTNFQLILMRLHSKLEFGKIEVLLISIMLLTHVKIDRKADTQPAERDFLVDWNQTFIWGLTH